ncbi:hypothetical protein Tco_0643557 [Tanacetum coccineum]
MTLSTLESVINPFRKISVWKKAVSFLRSLLTKLRDVEWKLDYKMCYSNPELATRHWKTEIRLTDPYRNIYMQAFVTKPKKRKLSKYHKLSDIISPNLLEHMIMRPGHPVPNALEMLKPLKKHYSRMFTTNSWNGEVVVEKQNLVITLDEIDQMLKISLKEAQSDEVIFFFVAWVRDFNIREPIYPKLCREFYATYEFDEVCADDELHNYGVLYDDLLKGTHYGAKTKKSEEYCSHILYVISIKKDTAYLNKSILEDCIFLRKAFHSLTRSLVLGCHGLDDRIHPGGVGYELVSSTYPELSSHSQRDFDSVCVGELCVAWWDFAGDGSLVGGLVSHFNGWVMDCGSDRNCLGRLRTAKINSGMRCVVMTELILRECTENAQAESSLAKPKINNNVKFELSKEHLKELRNYDFSISEEEDVVDHISKVLEILDLIKIPNVDTDRLRVHVFPFSLTSVARRWWINDGCENITT